MTDPKNQNKIINNNSNNAVLNEKVTYELEEFKKWLGEDESRRLGYDFMRVFTYWLEHKEAWAETVDNVEAEREKYEKQNEKGWVALCTAIINWKKEVTDQNLIKKSQEVAKISTELDQVLNKYQSEEIKPLNLTERYEEEREKQPSGIERKSISDFRFCDGPFTTFDPLDKWAIDEAEKEIKEKNKDEWFPLRGRREELTKLAIKNRVELAQAAKTPQLVQTALKKIENENLEIVKKERSELIGAMTLAKRNYEELIQATSDALKLKSKEIEDLTKNNKNIIEKGSEALEKAKREKEAIIEKLKFDKGKEKKDLDNAISEKAKELNKVSKEKESLETEKANTLIKLGDLEQTKEELEIRLNSQTPKLDQANKDKDRLEREKEELEKSIQTLAEEKESLLSNYNIVSKENHDLKTAAAEQESRILNNTLIPETKDYDLNRLKEKVLQLSDLNIRQRGSITAKAIICENLETKLKTAENTCIVVDNEKKELEKELGGVKAELANIKIDLNRVNVNLEAKDSEINHLKAKIERLESELAETKQQLSDTKIDLGTADDELERLKGEIDKLKKEVADREIYMQSLDDTKHKLVKESLELFNERNGLNTKINNLERQLEVNVQGTQTWKTRAETAESKEQDLKNKIFSEERKTSDLKVDKSSLEKKLKDQETALTNQIDNLKQELQLYKPTMTQQWAKWIGDKTGFNGLMGFFNNLIWIAGVFALLVFYSYLHKYLIKPSLKNFKKDKNDDDDNEGEEETPKPRRTKRVKPEPVIKEVEVTKPALVETETVKQLSEESKEIEKKEIKEKIEEL